MRSNPPTWRGLPVLAAFCVCGVAACSSAPPTTRQLATSAITAMGGADRVGAVRSLTMIDGSGSRWRLGQTVRPGDEDRPGALAHLTETLDLAGGRAAYEYDIAMGDGFTQHRQEVLATYKDRPVGLEAGTGRPAAVMSPSALFSWGSQNTPVLALRRNVIAIALAATHVDAAQMAEDRDLNGRPVKFGRVALNDETIGVYFDPSSRLIAAYEAMDTEPILGDVAARYVLDDYRPIDGVMLPHLITISKGAEPFAIVQFASATINDTKALSVFTIPSDATASAGQIANGADDYSPVTLTAIGDNVYFAQAYSHHSLVVEFPSYLVIVEAPYTEAQSKTLVRLLAMQFPGKPVRYAVVTHPHFDHIGGVRSVAAAGATILVARPHEAVLRTLLAARHTNPADDLATKRQAGGTIGGIQVFNGDSAITDGRQSLELHLITGSAHADPIVIAYVPSARVLFQSDLYFPATGASASPLSAQLLKSVRALKLDVRTNAGGHGGVAPFDELVAAGDAAADTQRVVQATPRQ